MVAVALFVLLTALAPGEPASPSPTLFQGGTIYRATFLRAAPGRLLDLIQAVKGSSGASASIYRHSQGDQWDLLVLNPVRGPDLLKFHETDVAVPVVPEALVAWQEDELVQGPDLEALPAFKEAGLAHIEIFHALAGKRADLLRQREMENAYLAAVGQPRNAIFVRRSGASWDVMTIGAYRSWRHYVEGQEVPADKAEAAALAAGFEGRSAIGPYLRTLILDHHDTLATPIR
jgi:hypothetical protein